MVSQGSLHESYGIAPDYPYDWESDDAVTQPTPINDITSEECATDEDLMFEVVSLEADLKNASVHAAKMEEESQEMLNRISELSTYTVRLAMERDNAMKKACSWKTCACVLAIMLYISTLKF